MDTLTTVTKSRLSFQWPAQPFSLSSSASIRRAVNITDAEIVAGWFNQSQDAGRQRLLDLHKELTSMRASFQHLQQTHEALGDAVRKYRTRNPKSDSIPKPLASLGQTYKSEWGKL